jgi:hypothetical protein
MKIILQYTLKYNINKQIKKYLLIYRYNE